jgi:hypothetical protein
MSEEKEKRKPMTREERDAALAKMGVEPSDKKKKKKNGNGGAGVVPPIGITTIASPLR